MGRVERCERANNKLMQERDAQKVKAAVVYREKMEQRKLENSVQKKLLLTLREEKREGKIKD